MGCEKKAKSKKGHVFVIIHRKTVRTTSVKMEYEQEGLHFEKNSTRAIYIIPW